MTNGSCVCGELKYEYDGEPVATGACHCIPCRKTSGAPCSYNLMIPTDKFRVVSGSLKQWTRKGDSGKNVTYNYCTNCPTIIFVQGDVYQGINILKTGTLDDKDVYNNLGYPGRELYTKNRPQWCKAIPGAEQKEVA